MVRQVAHPGGEHHAGEYIVGYAVEDAGGRTGTGMVSLPGKTLTVKTPM